jgi:hypothetical protein
VKEKQILFSTPMVRAILEGRKTQTRRLIKPQPQRFFEVNEEPLYLYDVEWNLGSIYPKYQPGDILWVKETWARISDWADVDPDVGLNDGFIYRADWHLAEHPKWRSSRYMPRAAARFFLEVKSARAERVQAITGLDCVKEGVAKTMESLDEALCDFCPLPKELQGTQGIPSGYTSCEGSECSEAYKTYLEESAIDEFADIWDELYAKRGYPWESNPWVWVYDFRRVQHGTTTP